MDNDRIGLGELIRTVNRIDGRTARMEAALFEERGIISRVVVLEHAYAEDREERRAHRLMVMAATFIGSTVGAAASFFGGHR